MKKQVNNYPEYKRYPQEVKQRVENIFSWTLEHCPYPDNIKDRITWIHSMERALRDVERESLTLFKLTK